MSNDDEFDWLNNDQPTSTIKPSTPFLRLKERVENEYVATGQSSQLSDEREVIAEHEAMYLLINDLASVFAEFGHRIEQAAEEAAKFAEAVGQLEIDEEKENEDGT